MRRCTITAVTACALAIVAALSGAVGAAAQTASGAPATADDRELIGLAEFEALFMGRTATFVLEDGSPWGQEYYVPGGRRTVFVFHTGECLEGRWEPQGERYCFFYREQPSCWLTFRESGRLMVEELGGGRQVISEISAEAPLSCSPDLFSQLAPSPATTPPS